MRCLSDPALWQEREARYLRVREREGRLYADDVVRGLPHIAPAHPLASEWTARRKSARRLRQYLAQQSRPLTILDLGCGNGWLAHSLSTLPGVSVCGLDVNRLELEQAARVFGGADRLQFCFGDVFSAALPAFDVIIVVSAIQYFSDLPALLNRLRTLLSSAGAIHILDSPLYAANDVRAAQARTERYYAALGFPDCAADYHHHPWTALAPFRPVVLYDPRRPLNRLKRRLGWGSPFPWIKLAP